MAFHHAIQRLLLVGVRLPTASAPSSVPQPAALRPLIEAIAPTHRACNLRAVRYGDRYRSAFWASFLLIALAVFFAGYPLAMGWNETDHPLHAYSLAWIIGELLLIGFVALIYWRGHEEDWQGQWLAARTQAELAWYLPLVAPLLDFSDRPQPDNWYACLDRPAYEIQASADFDAVCHAHRPLARALLSSVWSDPVFVRDYGHWAVAMLEGQRHYHQQVARRQQALQRRVHRITSWLFGLTCVAALSQLFTNSDFMTLASLVLPAVGASLHGALAQSEAYRLQAASERLTLELGRIIEPVRASLDAEEPLASVPLLRDAVVHAVGLILEEHQDWHMLVRPHHLPLG